MNRFVETEYVDMGPYLTRWVNREGMPANNACLELTSDDYFFAYNPHPHTVETTRGERVEEFSCWVEGIGRKNERVGICFFDADGKGMTMNGDYRDIIAALKIALTAVGLDR